MAEKLSAQERAARLQGEWNSFTADKRDALIKLEDEWRDRKISIREALYEAIRELFRSGKSVPEVSRITGNTNYTALYKLRADVTAGVPRQTAHSATEAAVRLDNIEWEYHDHIGTHGWLISKDRKYVKVYGSVGTPYEGEVVVATVNQNAVDGNEALLFSFTEASFNKKVALIQSLVDGTYTKATRLADNPWKD